MNAQRVPSRPSLPPPALPFAGLWLDAPANVLIGRAEQRPADASDADARPRRSRSDQIPHRANPMESRQRLGFERQRPRRCARDVGASGSRGAPPLRRGGGAVGYRTRLRRDLADKSVSARPPEQREKPHSPAKNPGPRWRVELSFGLFASNEQ
jgi:hypothetical protein